MAKKHADVGYVAGIVTENDVIVVVATSERLENEDVAHAFLAIRKGTAWTIFEEDVDIISVAAARGGYARHLASMGIQGEVILNEPSTVLHEVVHKGRDGPSDLRTMNEIRAIDRHWIAVGMRRQIYRRGISKGPWSRDDTGVLLPQDSLEIAGLLSVDGFAEDEIYSVGYRGEIWLRDTERWHQIESPTNARLECVRCGKDGTAVICGDMGVVLSGRGNQWTEIGPNGVDSTLTSAVWFREKWYVADEDGGLFVIADSSLQPEPGFAKLGATSGKLDANATRLLSVGEDDIVTFDGTKWQRVPHPPIDPT